MTGILDRYIDNLAPEWKIDKSDQSKYFVPYPNPSSVFSHEHYWLSKHLLPLATVNLEVFSPPWEAPKQSKWKGKIHFVAPIEPLEEYIGSFTKKYHNYYVRENWLAFKVQKNKYEFLADRRYFFLENEESDNFLKIQFENNDETSYVEFRDKLKNKYKQVHDAYRSGREKYLERRTGSAKKSRLIDKKLIYLLGGFPEEGNWAASEFPIDRTKVPVNGFQHTLVYPLTKEGRKFFYIGELNPNSYLSMKKDSYEYIADRVLLFYDPDERIALITFDWS